MDNFLKINDLVRFDYLNTDLVSIQDDFKNSKGPFKPIKDTDIQSMDAKGLKVRIAATHSGIITLNNMFYLPDKMKKATPTFLADYGKPILKHHDEKQDNIGRVIDASYVDTSGLIKDNFDSLFDSANFNESSLKDFCDGRMPFGLQVDFVRKYFNKPIRDQVTLLENDAYIGLGHVEIICDITDPDAVQKFLDGRFLTGSVGARTNKAVCSVCKQNWTADGECSHSPGAMYDGQKCVLIAGDFFYDEYSVVNSPADRQSRVLELYYNGDIKNIEVKNEYAGNVHEVRLDFPQYSKEDRMADRAKKEEGVKGIKDAEKKDTPETESPEVKVEDSTPKEGVKSDKVEDEEKLSSKDNFSKILDKKELTEEEVTQLYDMSFEGQDDLKDAKLSTEKRKGLSKSAFCGPSCSFPVPDASHVMAARRLLDKYKGPGDKEAILACVNRKAKAMGCDKKAKDSVSHARVLQMLTQTISEHLYEKQYRESDGKEPILSDEDMSSLTTVMKNLISMLGKDSFIKSLSSTEFKDVIKHFQDVSLLDEIIRLEEALGQVRDELNDTAEQKDAVKEEYDLLQKDNDALRDELVESKKSFRDAQVEKMSMLTSLKDGEVKEESKNEWLSLSDEALSTSLNKLIEEVDIKKMADKLNDGTSRNPEGEVEDPTLTFEDMTEDMKNELQQIQVKAFKGFRDRNQAMQWMQEQIDLKTQEKRSKDR